MIFFSLSRRIQNRPMEIVPKVFLSKKLFSEESRAATRVAVWYIAQHSQRCHMLCLSQPVLLQAVVFSLPSRHRSFSTDIQCKTIGDVAEYLRCGRFCKIVVMAGAGISTPSGIPDFRTPGTGLYDNLQKYNLPYAEAIFDINYFVHEPRPFFALAKELYPSGTYRPNIIHYFVKLLHEKGLLHRMYTQNIDGLERLAGIPEDKLIEAHGTFSTAKCQICTKTYKGSDIVDAIFKDEIPKCSNKSCKGVIKPDIVFFGEQLPERFWQFRVDLPESDLLIVVGTSLEVHPFAGLTEAILPGTPRLLFNHEATGSFVDNPRENDVIADGDLVKNMATFCELLQWKSELIQLMENAENLHKNRIQTIK